VVALTFDAGSDTGYAGTILDVLRNNGIHAAFGMTGRWAEANPALVQRMVSEGHELINHSYDHPSFTGLSTNSRPLTQEQRWSQLDRTEQIVRDLTGASTKPYFRPPYGDFDDSVLADVGARGYRYAVMWTVDSRGWQGIAPDAIVHRCLDMAEAGAIYIFHVGSESRDAAALQPVIDGLRDRGYEFATISELIG
jgi:peptidoglycan/xylan/chitin deacetylase (PgdA/CDA1 family)